MIVSLALLDIYIGKIAAKYCCIYSRPIALALLLTATRGSVVRHCAVHIPTVHCSDVRPIFHNSFISELFIAARHEKKSEPSI